MANGVRVGLCGLEQAAYWFIERFAELDRAGLLELMIQFKSATRDSPDQAGDDITVEPNGSLQSEAEIVEAPAV